MSLSWKQISVAQGNPYQKKESKPNKVIVKTFLPVNIWFSKAAAARGQYLHSRTDTIHWISETVAARWERIFTARGFLSFPKLNTFHIFDHEIQHIFYILAQYTHSLIESFRHDMLWYLFFPILLYSVPFIPFHFFVILQVWLESKRSRMIPSWWQPAVWETPLYIIAYGCSQHIFPYSSPSSLFSFEIRSIVSNLKNTIV